MVPFSPFLKYARTAVVGIIILGLCLFPSDKLPKMNLSLQFSDLVVHFIMFGALGVAIYLDITKNFTFNNKYQSVWIAVGASLGFGILTETLQYLLTSLNRTGNIMDLIFDFLGAVIAVLLIHFIKQRLASAS